MEQRRSRNSRFFSLCSILALKYSKLLLHICILAISLTITTSNCMSFVWFEEFELFLNTWTLFDLKILSFIWFEDLEFHLMWRWTWTLSFVQFEEEHVIFPWFENKFELVFSTWICFEFEKEFEFCLVWRRPCTCFQHLIEL